MLIFLQGIEIKWNESRWICPSSEPLDTILCFSEYPNYFQVVWHIGNLCASFSACYLEAVSQVRIVLWTVHLFMHYFTLNSSNILLKVDLVKWIQYTFLLNSEGLLVAGVKLKTVRVLLGDCFLDDCMYHAEAVPAVTRLQSLIRRNYQGTVSLQKERIYKFFFWDLKYQSWLLGVVHFI